MVAATVVAEGVVVMVAEARAVEKVVAGWEEAMEVVVRAAVRAVAMAEETMVVAAMVEEATGEVATGEAAMVAVKESGPPVRAQVPLFRSAFCTFYFSLPTERGPEAVVASRAGHPHRT